MRAMVELAAADPDALITAERIAEAQQIPLKFLHNIFQELRHAKLVESHRGPVGGHRLARPAEEITVADVIRAIDGPLGAVAGDPPEEREYHGSTVRLRDTWVALRASVRSVLEIVTVDDIASDRLPPRIAELIDEPDAWVRR